VTPSFNDARFLESTILSVTSQGYPNLEYIVIDGGSTDGSVEIIKKHADKITYWISEKDQGMYYAIQKGFEKCTGEIMGWINSDDILHPGSLFTIGQVFGDFPEVSWVQGMPNTLDERGRIVRVCSWPEITKLFFYKKDRDTLKYIQQESTYWRRTLWEKSGSHLSTQFRYAGDFELWMRFFQHARLYNLSALLGSFRVSNSGQASVDNFQGYVDETIKVLEKYPLTSEEKRKLSRIQLFEKIERSLLTLINRTKRKFNIQDKSTINNAIEYDSKAQDFKLNRKLVK
jgi:glycosyltransferase involved in cell wall biosynthesis